VPLSYTQNLEDYHLALAFEGQKTGFYIDVGAGHPVADNVSLWFYERGWKGIVAEPQSDLARLYGSIRPDDIVHQGLIGASTGEADFFHVNHLHGFSTTVKNFAENAKTFGVDYTATPTAMITLADLCSLHCVTTIDFLKIDVEGAEGDVLAGNDWTRYRPKIIVAEAVSPGKGEPMWETWEPLLIANGYRFRLFDTLNRFYVAEECPDLFERLPAERAPWDAVIHMYEIGRAPECARPPDHNLAAQLARGLWAALPELDPALVSEFLLRGSTPSSDATALWTPDRAGRIALGRIACGYDGGQIHED
jgi:FkbM family methyltransferase